MEGDGAWHEVGVSDCPPIPGGGRFRRGTGFDSAHGSPCSTTRAEGTDQFAIMKEAVWEIPEPLSICDVRLDSDTVTTLRQHGNASGPRLVLSHGSGLAADLYYPFWSLLVEDYELMVYDLRNHGWNSVGAAKDHNIPTLVRDHDIILNRIDSVYGNEPTVGIFHSLSAIVPLLSLTQPYSALVLFDPPLSKPGASQVELHTAAEQAAKRNPAAGTAVQDEGGVCRIASLHRRPSRASLPVSAASWHGQPSGWRRAGKDTSFAARASTKRSSWNMREASFLLSI